MFVYSSGSRLVLLACLITFLSHSQLVESLRKNYRSVEVCLHVDEAFLGELFRDESKCALICQQQFPHFNKGRNDAYIGRPPPTPKANQSPVSCCCDFEEPWPSFLQPKLANLNQPQAKQARLIEGECLPLSFGVRLSTMTRTSYKVICSYLSKSEPMSLLELLHFGQAAAHLNYMQPKHPAIKRTMRDKQLKRLTMEMMEKLADLIHGAFLDSLKPIQHFGGYSLDPTRLKEMDSGKRQKLRLSHERIDIVSRAFDEYMSSYAAMDIAAAELRISEINSQALSIPEHLILGQYDKYDARGRDGYFRMDGRLNCGLLRDTRQKLGAYLAGLKSALEGLFEQLYYDRLAENYDKLQALIHSRTIYKHLEEVNCRPPKGRAYK